MNVLTLLDAAAGAYVAPDVLSPDGRDAACVSVEDDGSVVVAFRGTLTDGHEAARDWLNDFDAVLTRADGFPGRVHAGFLGSLNAIWSEVFDAMETASSTRRGTAPLPWQRRVYVTGHSKGGAVAILAGVRLAVLAPVVVTFGAPMCGDADFAAWYPDAVRAIRYEADRDLVPHLPPYLFGYHAVGDTRTEGAIPAVLREARINRLIASGRWEDVAAAHHLDGEGGYRSWIKDEDVPPPAIAARRAA